MTDFRRLDIDVIVVDDEQELGSDIGFFLERKRVKSFVTTDPFLALKRALGHRKPFILLSDLKMPNMDGVSLVETLKREVAPDRDHEIVLFSGFADVDRAIAALRLGVLDFLVKPFDLEHLWLAVQRAFDQIEHHTLERQRSGIDRLAETLAYAKDVASRLQAVVALVQPNDSNEVPTLSEQLLGSNDWFIRVIKWHQSLRRLRDRIFPPCAFDDGSWEIVLYVLEQYLLKRPAPVTSACHATSIPQTTANRKVEELVECGLLLKHPDRVDRRRVLLSPTEQCIAHAEQYFKRVLQEAESMLRRHPVDAAADGKSFALTGHCGNS